MKRKFNVPTLPIRHQLPLVDVRTEKGRNTDDRYFLRGRKTVSVYCQNYLCGWRGRRVVLVDTDLDKSIFDVNLDKALKGYQHHFACPKCKDQSVLYGKDKVS